MSLKNILLIEDDAQDREIFTAVLKTLGPEFTCSTCCDAEEALSMLESSELPVDLIFLDFELSCVSGQEFLIELKKNASWKQTRIIVLSDSSDAKLIQETKELGASDYIIKPSKFSELRKKLMSILLPGQ